MPQPLETLTVQALQLAPLDRLTLAESLLLSIEEAPVQTATETEIME